MGISADMDPSTEGVSEAASITFETETFFSKVKRKCRNVVNNITLEPIFLFSAIFCGLDHVSNSQLLIYKSCINDFDFPNGTCDDLIHHKENNTAVQNEVAQYHVYVTIITHVFPFLAAFYVGSWSDSWGRKWFMYIGYITWILCGAIHLINVYFMDLPKEYMLLEEIPYALSGGGVAFSLSLGAFITDISPPDQRAFRMFMFSFPHKIGSPFGTQLGKILSAQGSFLCVSSATFVFKIVAFILFVTRVEIFYRKKDLKTNVKVKETPKGKKPHPLSPSHMKDSVFVVVRKRENNKRFYLILYSLVILTAYISFAGEHTVAYNYVRTRYGWEVSEYSDYSTITHIVDTVGQALIIPMINYFQLSSSNLVPILLSTITARHILKALAANCVENDELGKAFAVLSSIESLVPIAFSQLYTSIWKATSDKGAPLVGTCFFLSGALSVFALVLSCVGMVRLKGRDTSELTDTKQVAPRYIPSIAARQDGFSSKPGNLNF